MTALPTISFLLFIVFACSVQAQSPALAVMEVGDTIDCKVFANQRINKTHIQLQQGAVYNITAEGYWQDAGFDSTDANGFVGFTKSMQRGNFLKPMPGENYMMLIAKVRGVKTAIGTESILHSHKGGALILMPNDARFFFGNNSGSLEVRIVRVE